MQLHRSGLAIGGLLVDFFVGLAALLVVGVANLAG
jgi:hypothetical protein